ncbi:hypothetical protein F4821DRAFT_281335 [Hypoxylon rubiginosum]|uniref:Uncharacterized protein n=1 Tax=Hypoxylon rubiginosum TaxID=110542 RepID=A0ACC0CRJ9_9PEZI|nr:hypothetical protein F4821DRAFT_281335 [Hypoxylon rubiginosum]
MPSTSIAPKLSSKGFVALAISVLSVVSNVEAWKLEFWTNQADCNYKIGKFNQPTAADTMRSGLDHESNNCMTMSYDPDTDGIKAMRVTGWTGDCAIALWSDKSGSLPCQAEYPYGIDSDSQPPDHVFTTESPEAFMAQDADSNDYACITPLNEYIKSGSGFLGYIAYSCGGNGTLLLEEYKKHYDGDQVESLLHSLTATATSTKSRSLTATGTGTGTAVYRSSLVRLSSSVATGFGSPNMSIPTGSATLPKRTPPVPRYYN